MVGARTMAKQFVTRTVLGITLLNVNPGMWQICNATNVPPSWWGKHFMLHGTARLGTDGNRYTVNRWGNPVTDTTHGALKSAVRAFRIAIGIPGHAFPDDQNVDRSAV